MPRKNRRSAAALPDPAPRRWPWAELALATLILAILGCTGIPPGPPFRVPEEPPSHRARLIVYRADRQASLASVRLTVDGRELGQLRNHEYETILLGPGSHIIRAGLRGFAFLAWGWNTHQLRLSPGETRYLEISVRLSTRSAPPSRELEIGGRPSGTASENVFIVPTSAKNAMPKLEMTTRRRTSASDGS